MSYCVKCKEKTPSTGSKMGMTSNGRPIEYSKCAVCGSKKSTLLAGRPGKGLFNNLLNKLPLKNVHLPGHKFTGPFTELDKRVDLATGKPKPGFEPYNKVDEISMRHDICYNKYSDTASRNNICDKQMLSELNSLKPSGFREGVDKAITTAAIGAKYKLGFGRKGKGKRN